MEIQAGNGEIKEVSSVREEELEKLYKNLKEQETPDLWSRIEAGIETETEAGGEAKEEKVVLFSEKKQRKITGKQIRAMSAVAAAIVILLVSIPIISKRLGVSPYSVKNSTEMSSNAETMTEDSMGMQPSKDATEIAENNSSQTEESLGDAINSSGQSKDKTDTFESREELQQDEQREEIESDSYQEEAEKVEDSKTDYYENTNNAESQNMVHLEKVSETKLPSLEKIERSDLPKNMQKQLKERLDFQTCEFYQSTTGEVYVQEKGVWYMITDEQRKENGKQ